MRHTLAVVLPLILLPLAGCERGEDSLARTRPDHSDPLMEGALADHIMVDPDMVARNGANQAVSFLPGNGALPLPDAGPEAAAAARAEAIALLGGSALLRRAPDAVPVEGALPPEAALSVAARAASTANGANRDCAALARFSAVWAARLPAAFPVYPRGAVHEAAGTDEGKCRLRVVNFTTPVTPGDVMDFYYSRALAAGYSAQRVMQDGDDVLGGSNGQASFMVFARTAPGGQTSVDLVTAGG